MKVVSETSDMVITCVWGRGHDSVLALFSCWWERDSTKVLG